MRDDISSIFVELHHNFLEYMYKVYENPYIKDHDELIENICYGAYQLLRDQSIDK